MTLLMMMGVIKLTCTVGFSRDSPSTVIFESFLVKFEDVILAMLTKQHYEVNFTGKLISCFSSCTATSTVMNYSFHFHWLTLLGSYISRSSGFSRWMNKYFNPVKAHKHIHAWVDSYKTVISTVLYFFARDRLDLSSFLHRF